MKKVFIVIAAYNEQEQIGKVVEGLRKEGYSNIVVVDDGSTDNTTKIAGKGATVIRHVINMGQGAALQTGIDFAVEHGADIVVTFDADGQHQAKDIKKLLRPILNGEADVTLGSRFLSVHSDMPLLRRLFLKIGVVVLLVMYGIRLTDSHNGLRAFSREAAEKIEIRCNRMDHASEIPEQIHKKKLRYQEVPVSIKYTEYSLKHGQKSSDAFKIFCRMVLRKLMR
ncbi:MAG: glycosyltransferase family 2 protein [Candidatus Woesearchaeota archaeon]